MWYLGSTERKRPKYFWDILVPVLGTMHKKEKGNDEKRLGEGGDSEDVLNQLILRGWQYLLPMKQLEVLMGNLKKDLEL